MPDRADYAALVLMAGGLMALVLTVELYPSILNSGTNIVGVLVLSMIPTYGYAAYWAFSIRQALAVRAYRKQALGIGLVILAFISTLGIYGSLSSLISLQLFSALSTISWYALWGVLFYWIDASVLAARRSDPLLRDTLLWRWLRIPFWAVIVTALVVVFGYLGYGIVTGNATVLRDLLNLSSSDAILNTAILLPVVATFVGVILLPVIAFRIKWDRPLRMHFGWFGLFVGSLSLGFAGPFGLGVLTVLFFFGGFCLYRSAKSLVPMNIITIGELHGVEKSVGILRVHHNLVES
jgi:hypothetical protein